MGAPVASSVDQADPVVAVLLLLEDWVRELAEQIDQVDVEMRRVVRDAERARFEECR